MLKLVYDAENSLPDLSRQIVVDGIPAETALATPEGWVLAEDLHPGDMVLTFEQGPQPVAQVLRSVLSPDMPQAFWPLLVPKGAMENTESVLLLPAQQVLAESDLAEDLYGEPFVMLPASALEGWHGIARVAPRATGVLHLAFDRPQVIYAGRGLMLGCPGLRGDGGNLFDPTAPITLNLLEAKHLIACMAAEEAGAAMRRIKAGI